MVVCGEALVDVVAGVRRPGGSPFNTARALGRLGAPVAFLGHLSTDAAGRELARLLAEAGVSLELVTFGSEPTTEAVAHLDAGGRAEYEFTVAGTAAAGLRTATIPPHTSLIQFGSLGLALEPAATTLFELVERERAGRIVVLDPNVRPGLIGDADYRRRLERAILLSTVVKASAEDLAWLYPDLGHEAAAQHLLDLGVLMVVVTLGANGAFAAHGGRRVEVPAQPLAAVDTIGAGDAFGAALLAWLDERHSTGERLELSEPDLRSVLEFACHVAATALGDPTR